MSPRPPAGPSGAGVRTALPTRMGGGAVRPHTTSTQRVDTIEGDHEYLTTAFFFCIPRPCPLAASKRAGDGPKLPTWEVWEVRWEVVNFLNSQAKSVNFPTSQPSRACEMCVCAHACTRASRAHKNLGKLGSISISLVKSGGYRLPNGLPRLPTWEVSEISTFFQWVGENAASSASVFGPVGPSGQGDIACDFNKIEGGYPSFAAIGADLRLSGGAGRRKFRGSIAAGTAAGRGGAAGGRHGGNGGFLRFSGRIAGAVGMAALEWPEHCLDIASFSGMRPQPRGLTATPWGVDQRRRGGTPPSAPRPSFSMRAQAFFPICFGLALRAEGLGRTEAVRFRLTLGHGARAAAMAGPVRGSAGFQIGDRGRGGPIRSVDIRRRPAKGLTLWGGPVHVN